MDIFLFGCALAAICGLVLLVLTMLSTLHEIVESSRKERKDLLDRLMARDFGEYRRDGLPKEKGTTNFIQRAMEKKLRDGDLPLEP